MIVGETFVGEWGREMVYQGAKTSEPDVEKALREVLAMLSEEREKTRG